MIQQRTQTCIRNVHLGFAASTKRASHRTTDIQHNHQIQRISLEIALFDVAVQTTRDVILKRVMFVCFRFRLFLLFVLLVTITFVVCNCCQCLSFCITVRRIKHFSFKLNLAVFIRVFFICSSCFAVILIIVVVLNHILGFGLRQIFDFGIVFCLKVVLVKESRIRNRGELGGEILQQRLSEVVDIFGSTHTETERGSSASDISILLAHSHHDAHMARSAHFGGGL
mmetsp:Transcript_29583/g.47061  ORF Transcript_29583/g.47061 Transcript_29583/m.47061 type:complete len:226 (-) Transcript_29583:8-685(-)